MLQAFRMKRVEALRQFVGDNYSATGAAQRVPMNVIQQAVLIWLRQLVPNAPRAMCTTKVPQNKPIAANMAAWMIKATAGMKLDDTFRMWVLDALFSLGVLKIAEARVGDIEIQGTLMQVGQPFAEVVDLDDWTMDMLAKRKDQCEFMGNRYRVPLAQVKEDKNFNKEARENVEAQYIYAYNERGDDRPTTLSQGTWRPTQDEIEDHCELWDLFLPREKLIVTVPHQAHVTGGLGRLALRIQEWTGPQEGPYHLLSYGDVPDNIMPAAPVTAWMSLHEILNRTTNKLVEQSDRQKTITGYMGPATDDAARVQRSNDGDLIRMDFPDKVKEFRYGGVDREQMLWLMQVKQIFSEHAGNLETLGGLSPQAQTLGQEEILNSNSSAQVAALQSLNVAAFRRAYESLAFHWWHNPVLSYKTSRQVAGQDIPVHITPQMRQIPFDNLEIDIDPYSLQPDTPAKRGGKLMQIMQTVLLPLAPVLKEQGITVKWPVMLQLLSQYLDIPDLADILAMGPPPQMQGPMGIAQEATQGESPGMAPNTTRTNVRVNRPGMTNKGHEQIMAQLLGGGGNADQRGAAMRPTG